jgi:hypothetical protein
MSKRPIEGIASGGSGGKYPKLAAEVKTLTRGVIKPISNTNLETDASLTFAVTALPDQMIRSVAALQVLDATRTFLKRLSL